MDVIEYRTLDKSEWPDGPWKDEPDKIQWTDEATGLPCLIKRHGRYGNLCGYVGVPEGHPWHRRSYREVDAYVHAGRINYADHCQEGPEATSICHIPEPGEPDNVWWLGFSCDRVYDCQPGLDVSMAKVGVKLPPSDGAFGETYKDITYVRAECAALAEQAAEAAK